MDKSFKTDSSQIEDECQQHEVELFGEFSNPDILVQVSQLINWANTYAVYQSNSFPNTNTFIDGCSLVQGLQAQLESSHKTNAIRNTQISNMNSAKSALEQENEQLKQQLRQQSVQVEKFRKRNAKLENHEKKIAIREVVPLGKLKCKIANLQLIFDTLVSKLEQQPINMENYSSMKRIDELADFRRDVGYLFCRVKHNMKKWESNQKEMIGKLEKTRVGLNSLNETVMLAPLEFPIQNSSKKVQVHSSAKLHTSITSTKTVVQALGATKFDVLNHPSTSSVCYPKNKQTKSGVSVKTALSKHIKSRNIRRSNESTVKNVQNVQQSAKLTSTFTQRSRKLNLELAASNPKASRDRNVSVSELSGHSTNDAAEMPQKPKSPIVCGLCGTGFCTLVQLKLHHAVFHTESTGPAVRHVPQGLPTQSNAPDRHQNPQELHEAVQLAEYFAARQENNGASTSAAAGMENYLIQYLLDLAAGICIPSTQKSDSFPGQDNDRS